MNKEQPPVVGGFGTPEQVAEQIEQATGWDINQAIQFGEVEISAIKNPEEATVYVWKRADNPPIPPGGE